MKKLTYLFSLLVLLGLTGTASANEFIYAGPGPRVAAVVSPFPGFRLVVGRPGRYCWYQGHYYSRADWDRYRRFHDERFSYRYHRDHDRF
jgi:hypothetical protein